MFDMVIIDWYYITLNYVFIQSGKVKLKSLTIEKLTENVYNFEAKIKNLRKSNLDWLISIKQLI